MSELRTEIQPGSSAFVENRTRRVFPGVRGKAINPIRINDTQVIPKGTPILVQPLNRDQPQEPQRFKITVYGDIKPDNKLPEGQRNIELGESHEVTLKNPGQSFELAEYFRMSDEALFPPPGSPCLEDIKQGALPDCFLLASVQSILNHPDGKTFIRGMMTENEDHSVTVRLFNPKTLEPEYVRVPAGKLSDKQGSLSKHEALWVHVLESAYAAMGLKTEKEVDSSASSVFNRGDEIKFALTMLTGLQEQHEKYFIRNNNELKFLTIEQDAIDVIAALQKTIPDDNPGKSQMIQEMYTTNLDEMMEIPGFYSGNSEAAESDFKAYAAFYARNKQACDAILENKDLDNIQKIADLLTLAGNECEAGDPVFKLFTNLYNHYVTPDENQAIRLNTKAFSGFYTPEQHETYQMLQNSLNSGCLVNAWTTILERAVAGIREPHAYTVLEVNTRKASTTDSQTDISYVKLRNPWGHTGRAYKQEDTGEFNAFEDQNAGVFEIELTEFCNYFGAVTVSQSANSLFIHEKKRADLADEVRTILQANAKITNPSLDNLLDAQKEIATFNHKLVALEMDNLEALSAEVKQSITDIFNEKYDAALENTVIIQRLEMENPVMPFFTGNPDFKYEHLYNLLKLQWHSQQDPCDKAAMTDLQEKIVQGCGYDFCKAMEYLQLATSMKVELYKQQYQTKIDMLFRNILQLKANLDSPALTDIILLAENVEKLDKMLIHASTIKSCLSNLGVTVDNSEYEAVVNLFKQVKEQSPFLLEDLSSFLQQHKQLKQEIPVDATKVLEQGNLSENELAQVNHTIKESLPESTRKIAADFEKSPNTEKQGLASKLSIFAQITESISKIVTPFMASWKKLSNYGAENAEERDNEEKRSLLH